MRSIWNGSISFGLVSIPVKLFTATENHAISFRQIHTADGGRIRYRKVCELDEQEVQSAEIGKGYEDADGAVIPITDDDLAALPLPTARTIEIVAFVPLASVDPLQMDQAYYLSANGVPAAKPYTLLREALSRSRKVAVAKFALRGRERLGMLRVVDDVIAMHGLLWPDEIRGPEDVAPEGNVTVRDAELDLADTLMDTLGEVDLDSLHDDYRAAVEELIAAKSESGGSISPATTEKTGGDAQVLDLMAALKNSVRAAKDSHGGPPDAAEKPPAKVTELDSRKRTSAPKKAPAPKKSTAAKKTTATKKATGVKGTTAAKATASTARKPAAATKKAGTEKAGTKAATEKAATEKAGTKAATMAATEKAATKKAPAKKAPARKRTSA
ncbi:Ku protein [Streptomyces sp. NPDC091272]|uniref:non-homologous end joining protein Ku n=1 Tax=Streptomyces sp. NPDC091272 TaxID=3365981 RepID=UPI0037F74C3F